MDTPKDEADNELADQVDSALQALHCGETDELERLVSAPEPGPSLGELLGPVLNEQLARIEGLPQEANVPGYRIIREIGRGGMGIVYEAEQDAPRRRVALKVLRGAAPDERHRNLFHREIETLARLRHPAIATIYAAGRTEGGQYFFTMELVTGAPLQAYVRQKDLSLRARLELFVKICDAVAYAHQQGVIHRDLKPSNIMVDAENNVRVLDFGLAHITGADMTFTQTAAQTGQLVGTLRYMSPGQARGDPQEIDERSDAYSLGVILYELLTGQMPYDLERVSPPCALRVICETSPRKPSDVNPELRGDLDTILLKVLEKEAVQRYSSVAEFAADVRRYLYNEPICARRPSVLYVLRKRLSKHRLGVGVTLAAAVLALVGTWGGIRWSERALALRRGREQEVVERQHARDVLQARRNALRLQSRMRTRGAETIREEVSKLLDRFPDVPEVALVGTQFRFNAARQSGGDAGLQGAMDNTEDAIAPGRSPWAFRTLLAEMCSLCGDQQKAERLMAEVDREMPDTAEAWYLRSVANLNCQEAVRCAQEATRRDPNYALAWELLAYLRAQTREYDFALTCARTVVAIEGTSGEWATFEGPFLLAARHYREAIAFYDRVIALAPDADFYRRRAIAHLCLRDYDCAIEDYTRNVELEGRARVWGCYQRATPLWIKGRLDEAEADLHTFAKQWGRVTYADARLFLVLCDRAQGLRQGGRGAGADELVGQARAELEAARGNNTQGRWLESIFACLLGKLTPDDLVSRADHDDLEQDCESYYYAGEVCLMNGWAAEARTWFRKCVDTDLVFDANEFPPEPMSEYHLAVWRLAQLEAK